MNIPLKQHTKTEAKRVPVRVHESKYGRSIQRPNMHSDPYSAHTQLWSRGPWGQTPLVICTDAPAPGDFLEKAPFQSDEGRRVRGLCSAAGILMDSVWLTHLVDRQLRSQGTTHEDAECIEAQANGFWSELEVLHQQMGATVIIGLGQLILSAFGVQGGLDANRGSIVLVSLEKRGQVQADEPFDLILVPTYHPRQLVKGSQFYEKNDMKVDITAVAVEDFKKANDLAENGYTPVVEKFILEPTLADVIAWNETLQPNTLMAVDIETTALEPHEGKIVVIGFARDTENAIAIPLLTLGGKNYWSEDDWFIVHDIVVGWLSRQPLMFQNGYFDVYWLREHDFFVPKFAIKHDTLVLHHSSNPELDHDIGFIASMYAKITYWKDVFKSRKVPILQMDQIEMRRYNLRDCTVLHQCLPGLWADLEELGEDTVRMYQQEAIPMIEVCLELHDAGVPFSETARKLWEQQVAARVAECEQKCRRLGCLDEKFSLNSDMDMRVFLFGEIGTKYKKADDLLQKKPGTKLYRELQALDYVRNLKPLWLPTGGFAGRKTDTGLTKVDEQGRLSLQVKAQNRLAALKELKQPQQIHFDETARIQRLLDFLKAYGDFAEAVKLQETYTEWKLWPDGRVHSHWKSFGTATGRLASKGPNAQNWPKEGFGHGVRDLFVAPEGWAFLSMDYANLEVGTMAYTSKEPNLVKVFEQGINLHDLNTQNLFGISSSDPNWKMCRAAAKVFQFGIQYGGGVREIYEKIGLKVPDLGLTYAEYSKCVDRYFKSNPVYTAWRDQVQATVKHTREVRTPFGRVRRFYGMTNDIVKEALNFPCQSAAASIINLAALRVLRHVWSVGMESRLVLQIHDQLVMLCPLDEIRKVKDLMLTEMTRPVDWNGEKKSFPVDPEAGFSFGGLMKWADFEKEHLNG